MALDYFAGCIGGVAGVLVGHPFDTVKVRLQTQSAKNPLYNGTVHCFTSIIKKEGVRGLFKGMASPMCGLSAINAVIFGVQANVQRNMTNPDSLSSHFISGAVAGTAQSLICSPMELAKTRMQTQGLGERLATKSQSVKGGYTGPVDCLTKLFKVEGIRGIYRGLALTIAREAPSFGCYFFSYECICRFFDKNDGSVINTPTLLFAGGTAGMLSWFFTYPIDVIKSRVQNDKARIYKNAIDCARKSYAEDGYKCFSRGLGATMLRAFPINAATFTTVTWVLRLANRADESDTTVNISELPAFEKHQWQHHEHVRNHEVDVYPSHP